MCERQLRGAGRHAQQSKSLRPEYEDVPVTLDELAANSVTVFEKKLVLGRRLRSRSGRFDAIQRRRYFTKRSRPQLAEKRESHARNRQPAQQSIPVDSA
jgi:hypothetical protein